MKPFSKHRRLAGILAVAALAPAYTAWSHAAPHAAPVLACTTVPTASGPTAGTGRQQPQWDMPPVPGGWTDIAARSSSSALAVGGTVAEHGATVARWNGTAWQTLSSRGLPRGVLSAVAVSRRGAWAVGQWGASPDGNPDLGHPLMVRVTGTRVRQVPIPRTGSGSFLADVAATSAADAWAAGGSGPLILHWNGTAWKRVQLPAAVRRGVASVDGVAATSKMNAWAIMSRHSRLPGIAHWNGRRWANVASPHIGMRYGLGAVAATGKDVWAVGLSGVIMHWNGRKWTCARTRDELLDVTASSADNAWAVGVDGNLQALTLHWNGHTWKHVMTPAPDLSSLFGVAIIPRSGRAWAVGEGPVAAQTDTLMLHWNGTAWQ